MVSKIILTLIFFLIVTPVGLIRRWTGADSLQLKKWKQGTDSVFVERQGVIQDKDLRIRIDLWLRRLSSLRRQAGNLCYHI